MLKHLLASTATALFIFPAGLIAQEDGGDWDVTAAHAETTEIDFVTDEGTWMSVDVNPAGSQIVFDMLGDIFVMPITGGEATLLRGGSAYETQPRYSPDGSRISFTSDRAGSDNLWTMAADGTDLKQITDEQDRQVSSAIWTPDGQYLIGRKHYRNTRSLGAGEMWMYHVGGGEGLRLTDRPNWEQSSGEPALSPDGRYLYYSEDVSPGGGFQYNRDPHAGIYAIKRLDRETGDVETFIRGPGGAIRPEVSPDGETLSFIRRVGLNSVLFVQDLDSGRETALFDGLSHDQQEAWSILGVYPSYDWTPDGESIIIYGKGKIWKIDADTGAAEQIPFQARVQQSITEAVRFPQEVAPETFDVKMLRWVTVAPDEQSVIYNALGKLWLRPLPEGTPRRITSNTEHWELHPSFSPDGSTIVYTTWDDADLGAVWTVRPDGSGARKISMRPGHYVEPAFSPDGQWIAFRRVGGDGLRGDLWSRETGIYIVPATGGEPRLVTENGSAPTFSADGDRIFLTGREDGNTALVSVDLNGADRRVHLISENASQIAPSPDGEYVAWVERYNAYVAPLPMTGRPVSIGPNTNDYPIRQISRDAGIDLHWSADGERVFWSLGPELYERALDETFSFASPADEEIATDPLGEGRYIGFSAETAAPAGSIALVGATVITMDGDRVVPNATVVVRENRITAVGPASSVEIPGDAKRVDVAGKYIIPGIIDVHAHYGNGSNGIAPETSWGYYANLAYGVTSMHNPSTDTEMSFANSELVKAGKMVAPRLFSTGRALYGAEGGSKVIINSYEDALSNLRRLKKVGAFSVKSYNLPRREQRQQVVEAARELEMMVVPEGGSTYYWNMAQILDGHTGIEHNIPVAPLYKDALTLISSSETGYTPTLVVNFGGLSGEFFWYQESNVWENEKLLTFTPRGIVDARSRRRVMAAPDDYFYKEVSATANDIVDMGGSVQLGAHGQLEGLGAHWELWMLGQGGMTPMEALRAATIAGAEYLGLDGDLGSVEEGKLADLVVLDQDPLENLRNSDSIRYVMANGQLFDAATMNLVGNHPAERPAFYWER